MGSEEICKFLQKSTVLNFNNFILDVSVSRKILRMYIYCVFLSRTNLEYFTWEKQNMNLPHITLDDFSFQHSANKKPILKVYFTARLHTTPTATEWR